MAFKRFEEVIAWQQARTLVNEILSVTGSLDAFKKEPELARRLQNVALDVQCGIARAFAYRDSGLFLEGLQNALGSSEELRSLLFSAADRECINLRIFERLTRSIQGCSSKIQELITYVKHQLKSQKQSSETHLHRTENSVIRKTTGDRLSSKTNTVSRMQSGSEQPTSPLQRTTSSADDFLSDDFGFQSGSNHNPSGDPATWDPDQ
jgi:four helix bundle protein